MSGSGSCTFGTKWEESPITVRHVEGDPGHPIEIRIGPTEGTGKSRFTQVSRRTARTMAHALLMMTE
jgi:hypothetical protein